MDIVDMHKVGPMVAVVFEAILWGTVHSSSSSVIKSQSGSTPLLMADEEAREDKKETGDFVLHRAVAVCTHR